MARVKNITDDVLEVPSLGLFGVQPGQIIEVPRASDFENVEGWQVTATGTPGQRKARKKSSPAQAPAVEAGPAYSVGETGPEVLTTTDEESSL